MRRADRARTRFALCLALLGAPVLAAPGASVAGAKAGSPCEHPVYLTFDTGHMGVAPLVADVLKRHQVPVTFFLANERTQPVGDRPAGASLDDHWAPWWKAMAAQGHDFGSHTWDHLIWRKDTSKGFTFRPTAGPDNGRSVDLSAPQYCEELARSAQRFQAMTGQPMRALFRAPGGKTSPKLLAVARACGWHHVPWTPAGFLGDELSSERYPNQRLLQQALTQVRQGDILLAHLGIWSRQEPWAPAVLEPLIVGLKAKGLCFATLREHPDYRGVGAAP
ncbi:polysaccharide deacetylase family protein [Aquabacterium soli]|uniref:Polysaccharide deacetylase family protein n=1 Tax=Aquabacterium soli TaxID=2493092 RepID=A0A3R8T3F4_9BURK|nr:polysaccharide deacetylase family protein [Aquabacterium soli]RRS03075.1 polysaccharide deacetylase family protein [Aquabacterium soli]